MTFLPRGRNQIQHAVAWIGVLLIVVCVGWLQILPRSQRSPRVEKHARAGKSGIGLVVIDAGHGGQDSGATRNGVLEKDLTLDVARRVEGLARVRGFRTMMTRPSDTWMSLSARAAAANRENDCVFVSIHFDEGNRPAATGVGTFYAQRQKTTPAIATWLPFLQPLVPAESNVESQSLAGFVQQALVARTHAQDRGTRAEQFFVVANVRHPAVLVEGGFLSNNDDLGKLATEAYRQELAAAITDGIARYRDVASAAGGADSAAGASAE
jgi:N-acetylmuramoyl-L-alanine amidase